MRGKAGGLKHRRKRLLILMGLGLGIGLLVLLVSSVNVGPYRGGEWFDAVELKGYDWMSSHFSRQLAGDGESGGSPAIVAIDQESIEQIGSWPWDRSLHAKLVDTLQGAGARTIAIDILFSSPKSEEGDASFTQAIKSAGNVVLASSFSGWKKGRYEAVKVNLPLATFSGAAAGTGFTNVPTDRDGMVRKIIPTEVFAGYSYNSFSLEAVAVGRGGGSAEDISKEIPLDADGEMFINFSPDFEKVTPEYSFRDVMEKKFSSDAFEGKLVFVGVTGGAKRDAFPTPVSGKEDLTPGVEIQARAAATIDGGAFISQAPSWPVMMMMVLVGPLSLLLFLGRRMWLSVVLAVILVAALIAAEALSFRFLGLWLPFFAPAVTGLVSIGGGLSYRYFAEVRKEKKLRETFGKYVSPEVLNELISDPESAAPGGRLVEASILFCDMRGFTGLAGALDPPRLLELLNRFLSEVSKVIFKFGGMIDKFVGDEVMAIFGAPIETPDHVLRSCAAALEIQAALGKIDAGPGGPLKAGVGINSGKVVVGSIGSERRMDYTAVGDVVNVASRLQSLTRDVGQDIVIGPETRRLAGGFIEARPLGQVSLKGRKESLEAFVLVGFRRREESPHAG